MRSNCGGRFGIQLIRRRRVAVENAFEDDGRSIPIERLLAGGRLVERCAQGKQVGAPIEFFSPSLLGRHVGDRPQGASGTGQVFQGFFGGGGVQVAPVIDLGQPEIEQLHLACLGDEDVGRLDIAVHDAFAVGRIERVGDLDAEIEHEVDGQGLSVDAVFERLAFEVFHRQVGSAVFFADVVDGADIGVVQRRGGPGLAAEPVEHGKLAADLIGEKFERDEAPQAGVLGLVDHAHSPAAKLFDHSIMGYGFADHGPALA